MSETCQLYLNDLIDGQLCEDLCNNKVQIGHCFVGHHVKDLVFEAKWRDKQVINKKKANYSLLM